MLTLRSNPIYRKSWKHYMFYIWANNSIGFENESEHYFQVADLNHYAVGKLDKMNICLDVV